MEKYKTFSTPEEVVAWVNLHYAEAVLEKLNADIYSDSPLAEYKGKGYIQINTYLRHRWEDMQHEYNIKGLQDLLLSMTICEPITVFRFVSWKELCVLLTQTFWGRVYEYPSFLSTTLLKDEYAMDEIKKGRTLITILIPKGTKGTYIPEVNYRNPEFEILLPYRQRIKRISWNVYEIMPMKSND